MVKPKLILANFICASAISFCSMSSLAMEGKSPIYFEIGSGISMNSGKEGNLSDLSSSNNKFKNKTSIPLSASIGYRYSPNFRWDINVTYLPQWDINLSGLDSESDRINLKSSISSLSSSINGYYDFDNLSYSGIIPYITAGIGFSINKTSDSDYYINDLLIAKYAGTSTNNLLWKVGLGATHKINEHLFIDLSYKFVSLGTAKSKSGYKITEDAEFSNANQFILGMGFNF